MKDRKTRICMACCPGGHFAELRLATKEISESEYDIYWLTFKSTHLKGFLHVQMLLFPLALEWHSLQSFLENYY